jgi:predicted Zn-dependent protease
VLRAWDAYRADPRHRYQDQAGLLVRASAALHGAGFGEPAVALLDAAARAFPDEQDVFVVLAQVAEQTGRRDVARQAAERALALDPNERTARTVLERLRTSPR